MSTQDFTFDKKVSVNLDPQSNVHTMRELTEKGYELQTISNNLRSAANSMAEHYHAIALKIERDCRKEFGSAFKALGVAGTDQHVSADERDQKAIRKALATFRVHVGTEIAYLQQNKGWDKDKMPSACDSAIRRIYAAWENHFSLEVLPTCSKLGKANADRKKEEDAKIAGVGAQALAAQQGDAVALTGNKEMDEALAMLIENAKAAVETDSKSGIDMVMAAAARIEKHIKGIAASAASRAVA